MNYFVCDDCGEVCVCPEEHVDCGRADGYHHSLEAWQRYEDADELTKRWAAGDR